MDDIIIKKYTKAELMQLYHDSAFWEQDELPFTRARLACYLQNSRAEPENVLWIMAFQGANIVGYRALLPEYINTLEGVLKIAWSSSWWVDSKFRGTGLAQELNKAGFPLYNGVIIGAGNPWALKSSHRKDNFEAYQIRERKYYFLAINKQILRDHKVSNPLIYMLLPLVNPLLSLISKIRIKRWLAKNKQANLKVEYIHKIDQESLDLIQANADRELVVKDAAYYEYRAFLPSRLALPSFITKKHHSYFGNVGSAAECRIVKLWQADQLVGVINYCIIDKTLRIRLHHLLANHEDKLVYLIAKICSRLPVEAIASQDAFVIGYLQRFKLPYLFCKTHTVPIIMTQSLVETIGPGRHFFDGEGGF